MTSNAFIEAGEYVYWGEKWNCDFNQNYNCEYNCEVDKLCFYLAVARNTFFFSFN